MDRDDCRDRPRRGGKRVGAGRKQAQHERHDPPHRARRELSSRHPVHVVLRASAIGRLRQRRTYRVTRRVLARYLGRADFRVVHVSIQHNHFHLLIEAADRRALTRGMQSLTITLAKAFNRDLDRAGEVNNWRKHREDLVSPRAMAAKLDPYASGFAFTGWNAPRVGCPAGYDPLPVSPASTRLLRSDWIAFGRIDLFETPGPLR